MAHTHGPGCGHHHGDPGQKLTARAFTFRLIVGLFIVAILLAFGSSFQVSEGNRAIVTRFGNPVGPIREPGLHWKLPWPIEQVHTVDVRLRQFNPPFTETLTHDRKILDLRTYVVWRVDDPLLYFQSLGDPQKAEDKLANMVAASKNFYMGNYDLSALVSIDADEIKTPQIEQSILTDVGKEAASKFGIAVEQVGLKRVAYPEQNSEAVLEQMRAERQAEAGRLRAEGKKEAQKIRDEGDKLAAEITSKAKKEAGEIEGAGQREAQAIYTQAAQLDPEFFAFWQSIQVVKKALSEKATVILRTDQEPFATFFRGEGDVPGGAASPAIPARTSTAPAGEPALSASALVPEEAQ